jgi:hypothetical protein
MVLTSTIMYHLLKECVLNAGIKFLLWHATSVSKYFTFTTLPLHQLFLNKYLKPKFRDEFCDLCYKAMHRKGARKQHTFKRLRDENKPNVCTNPFSSLDIYIILLFVLAQLFTESHCRIYFGFSAFSVYIYTLASQYLYSPQDNNNNNNNNNNNSDNNNNNNTNNKNKDSESDSEEEEDENMDREDRGDKENKAVDSDDDDEGSEPSLKRPSISRYPYTTTPSATATHDRYFAVSNYTSYGKANSYYNKGNTSITSMYNQKPPPPPENKSPAEKYIPSIKKDGPWFEDRAKYIPLRLTMDERKALRLLEASLHVCDYTGVPFHILFLLVLST